MAKHRATITIERNTAPGEYNYTVDISTADGRTTDMSGDSLRTLLIKASAFIQEKE